MEIKRIETYSLYEFCQAVQQSIIEGWRFDFESNELFPTAYGSMLITGMVKKEQNKIQEKPADNQNIAQEDNQVKRGRKPKDNI